MQEFPKKFNVGDIAYHMSSRGVVTKCEVVNVTWFSPRATWRYELVEHGYTDEIISYEKNLFTAQEVNR